MPLETINQTRLTDAVRRYRNVSKKLIWNQRELPKFYFAGLLSSRVNLVTDSPAKILTACQSLQFENLYFQIPDSRVAGIQFLNNVGDERFDNPLTVADVELMKQFAMTSDWRKWGIGERNVSYTTISAWLGTLRPWQFMPVSSTLYRHSCAYLFNLETTIYDSDDIDFFIRAQCIHFILKRALKAFDFTDIYLREIGEFLKTRHPKIPLRKEYNEIEWNWLTQDFLLFIYREMLGFDEFCEVDDEEFENALCLPGLVPQFVGMQ